MRRSVFVLYVLGFTCLVVGSVLNVPSVRSEFFMTIRCSGRIACPDGSAQQFSDETRLDLLGYATVLASVGFFAVAFLWNRRLA